MFSRFEITTLALQFKKKSFIFFKYYRGFGGQKSKKCSRDPLFLTTTRRYFLNSECSRLFSSFELTILALVFKFHIVVVGVGGG